MLNLEDVVRIIKKNGALIQYNAPLGHVQKNSQTKR